MAIARNPKTGEVLRLDEGGNWVPTQQATNPETGESLAFDGTDWVPLSMPKSDLTSAAIEGGKQGLVESLPESVAPTDIVPSMIKRFLPEAISRHISTPGADLMGAMKELAMRRIDQPTTEGEQRAFTAARFGVPAALSLVQPGGTAARLADVAGTVGAAGGAVAAEEMGLPPEVGSIVGAVGGSQGMNIVRNMRQSPLSAAQRKVVDALEASGLSPDEALQRVQQMGPEATLADVSGHTRRLTKQGMRMASDEVTEEAGEQLMARREGQASRFEDKFRDTVQGHRMADDFETLSQRQIDESKPFYDVVDRVVIQPDQELIELTRTKDFKKAWEGAKRLAEREGRTLPDSPVAGRFSKLRDWDYVKRALDDAVGAAKRKGKGNEAASLAKYRTRLRDKIDDLDQSGAYREARRLWAGPEQAKQAMLDGQKFWKTSSQVTPKQLAEMDPADLAFYRIGAVEQLIDDVQKKGFTQDVTLMFNNPRMQTKLRTLLGEEMYEDIASFISLERQMQRTATRAMVGSDTRRNIIEDQRLGAGDIMDAGDQAVRGNLGNAAINVLRSLKDRLVGTGFGEKRANEIVGILLEQNPQLRRAALHSAPVPTGTPISPAISTMQGLNIGVGNSGGGGGF